MKRLKYRNVDNFFKSFWMDTGMVGIDIYYVFIVIFGWKNKFGNVVWMVYLCIGIDAKQI